MPRAREAEQPVTLSFAKGIDESQEASTLPAGFLVSGKNWVPEPTGVLRSRVGWLAATDAKEAGEPTYPSTASIRGMFYVTDYNSGGPERRWWVVALMNADDSDHSQVWVLKGDLTGGWIRIFDATSAEDFNTYPVAFGKSTGQLIVSHPDFTQMRKWDLNPANDCTTIASMTDPGRAVAFHKSRMWSGGSKDDTRYRLYYSNLNNANTWTIADDYLDVGEDDGEAIETLQPFQGQLIIAKRNSVYILTGGSPTTFSLFRLDGVRGSRGRSLVPTPKGVVILGEEEAWLWSGGDPEPISGPVQDTYASYGGEGADWRWGRYVGGKVYITGNKTGHPVLVFDPHTGVWHMEDQQSDAERLTCFASSASRLAAGPKAGVIAGPLIYRDLPFGTRTKDFSTTTETFTARTPDWALTKGRQPIHVRHVWVQVRQREGSAASTNDLTVTVYGDEQALVTQAIESKDSPPKVWMQRIDLGKDCRRLGFQFSTTIPAGGGAMYDIEGVEVDVGLEPPR